jgi:hypothetical protein
VILSSASVVELYSAAGDGGGGVEKGMVVEPICKLGR